MNIILYLFFRARTSLLAVNHTPTFITVSLCPSPKKKSTVRNSTVRCNDTKSYRIASARLRLVADTASNRSHATYQKTSVQGIAKTLMTKFLSQTLSVSQLQPFFEHRLCSTGNLTSSQTTLRVCSGSTSHLALKRT